MGRRNEEDVLDVAEAPAGDCASEGLTGWGFPCESTAMLFPSLFLGVRVESESFVERLHRCNCRPRADGCSPSSKDRRGAAPGRVPVSRRVPLQGTRLPTLRRGE